jgi:hypothetical protein
MRSLRTLHLGGNRLASADDVAHLAECSSTLVSLDLCSNQLEGEGALQLLERLPLLLLRLQGNPLVSSTR